MRPPAGYDPASEAPHAPLGRWVRWDGLWAGSPFPQLLWWLIFSAAEHETYWGRVLAESIAERGYVAVLCNSCVRCGRSWVGYNVAGDHYCGRPYFRPRGHLHPDGPTAGQLAAEARAVDAARVPSLF